MLETIDMSRKIPKAGYKKVRDELELTLAALQRRAKDLGIPISIVFEGWAAAGKGTLINKLILPLDPRGFTVHNILPPNEEEKMYPFLWRFWTRTPERGRIAIFDRSWYRRLLEQRVNGLVPGNRVQEAANDILSFERHLADDGNVIIKFFLHISKKEQGKRFEKLKSNSSTAWRVSAEDEQKHKQYDQYLAAIEDMLAMTDSDFAPWTVVEAHDERFATLKIFTTAVHVLQQQIDRVENNKTVSVTRERIPKLPDSLRARILDTVDLSLALDRDEYRKKLRKRQKHLRELEHQLYMRRISVVVVYEGWDAAGKGGNIRRLTQRLDPRGYEVVPIAAPNDIEKAHHYLWRFWTKMPKAGHLNIFDRSWYGRVLVERVEGFCSAGEWKRAYREINQMEHHLTHFGTVLLKFWIHIDQEEQLRRFEERKVVEHKQWKITEEDWRNREKWDQYKVAVEEMLFRTSTPYAPWTIVESNCKLYARIKVLETTIRAIEERLKA